MAYQRYKGPKRRRRRGIFPWRPRFPSRVTQYGREWLESWIGKGASKEQGATDHVRKERKEEKETAT